MKIKIGPYRNWWTSQIHYNYMNKKYNYQWEQSTTKYEHFLEKLEDILQTIYNKTVNLFEKERKVNIKIDDYDVWSMDSTLALIIVPMLKKLRKTKHGAPFVDLKDVPKKLHPPKDQKDNWKNGDVDETHHARWDWILDEMIWAFEQVNEDWEAQYTTGEYDLRFEKIEGSSCSELKTGPNHTAVTDWKAREAHQKRMENGFRLFGKYYQALWS